MKITKRCFLFALMIALPIVSMMGNMKMGDNKFDRKDFIGAIQQYKKTADLSSNDKRVALAKYKIGESYSLFCEETSLPI